MSKPNVISNRQDNLFQSHLSQQLNPKNPLFQLSKLIDWAGLESSLDLDFSSDKAGQPPKPIRLMVGLLVLQHMEGLSDEAVVEKWVEKQFFRFD